MSKFRNRRMALLLLSFGLILTSFAFAINPPPPIGSIKSVGIISDPNASLKQINASPFQPFNGTDNASTHTITFNVFGIESQQPTTGVIFTVTTTGPITVGFVGSQPRVFCGKCSSSYAVRTETITFTGGLTDALTVIWSQATIPTETQNVLLIDDFLQTSPFVDSLWQVNAYNSPQSNTGLFTSSGYLFMRATSTSGIESAHAVQPMYNPASVSGNLLVVKRKMTVAALPFSRVESNTAVLKIGLTPLLSTGNYPGNTPAGTPYTDTGSTCSTNGASTDKIGSNYAAFNNSGTVTIFTCGDGGFNKQILETGLNPSLYTVFTVETYGIFCSGCVDNASVGSTWVFFRVYQEVGNQIVTSTDKNMNFTSNVAPLYQTVYSFVAQTNSNSASTSQLSKIDFVQVQNYGSPVCLSSPIGSLCNGLPPVPNALTSGSSIIDIFAYSANLIGFGDEGLGATLLFFMALGVIAGGTFAFTRNIVMSALAGLNVVGFYSYAGLIPSFTIFLVILGDAVLIVMIVMRLMHSNTLEAGSQ